MNFDREMFNLTKKDYYPIRSSFEFQDAFRLNEFKIDPHIMSRRKISIDRNYLEFDDRSFRIDLFEKKRHAKFLSCRHSSDQFSSHGFKNLSKVYRYHLI